MHVATFTPHPGECFTRRHFGERVGVAVSCGKPGHGHVRSQAERGCAFWEREPGADDDFSDARAASAVYRACAGPGSGPRRIAVAPRSGRPGYGFGWCPATLVAVPWLLPIPQPHDDGAPKGPQRQS
jgi:hypothetical protein